MKRFPPFPPFPPSPFPLVLAFHLVLGKFLTYVYVRMRVRIREGKGYVVEKEERYVGVLR